MTSIMSEGLESACCVYTMVVICVMTVLVSSCMYSKKLVNLKVCVSEDNTFHIMCLISGSMVSLFLTAIV